VLFVSILGGQSRPADISGPIVSSDRVIAVPDFRGSGDAQKHMATFNKVLWDELSGSGVLKLAPRSMYPLETPQQPEDFKAPTVTRPVRRDETPRTIRNGPWFTDWSGPPVGANYLAFGYSAVQEGRLVIFGWLFNLQPAANASPQLFGHRYFGSPDNQGAKATAREFAADILKLFGAKSLLGTKIYFASDRSGGREIWSMDYDGDNQKQVTDYKSQIKTSDPAISPDGKTLACVTYPGPYTLELRLRSTETGARLPFRTPAAPILTGPEFTRDGDHVLFATRIEAEDSVTQIYMSDLRGGNLRRISQGRGADVEPRVNPKTGADLLFISDVSGGAQLWRMNLEGADRERLTNGEGTAANPAWRPDAQVIAFSWTLGYERGGFNIFVMDIADRKYVQLTHGEGANEHPWWAPDGVHLVFTSNRSGTSQIYTMLADGTDVRQLTRLGHNTQPVWANPVK
jgi:TolB protein